MKSIGRRINDVDAQKPAGSTSAALQSDSAWIRALTNRRRLLIIWGVTVVAAAAVFAVPPIPQDPGYHTFADRRAILGLPNFFDVVSNAPFLLVGVLGFILLAGNHRSPGGAPFVHKSEKLPYAVLFLGLALTTFGSGYYHLAPDNGRLVWDRLPMTLVFVSFVAAAITERISVKLGLIALLPLIVAGVGSVIYWQATERAGAGDLRPYVIVQFYSMLLIILIMLLFSSRYTRSGDVAVVLVLYGLSKAFELLDKKIFALGGVISGHTLKHLAAGLAAYWIWRMLRKRHPVVALLRRVAT